jgi:hypothetical protein
MIIKAGKIIEAVNGNIKIMKGVDLLWIAA